MKKDILSLLCLLLVFAFGAAACDKGDGEKKDGDAEVRPDLPTDLDTRVDPDAPADLDVRVDPDIAVEQPEIGPDITTDLPDGEGGECGAKHGGTCNVVTNCGCTGDQACDILVDETTCTLIEGCGTAGTIPLGGDCGASASCAVGTICLIKAGNSRCYKWCETEADCEAGRSCNIGPIPFTLQAPCSGTVNVDYKACELPCDPDKRCDPFLGTGCAAPNNACVYDFDCAILMCGPSGTLAPDADCGSTAEDCPLGTECISTSGATGPFKCYKFCDDAHACTTGTCHPLGYTTSATLGICY